MCGVYVCVCALTNSVVAILRHGTRLIVQRIVCAHVSVQSLAVVVLACEYTDAVTSTRASEWVSQGVEPPFHNKNSRAPGVQKRVCVHASIRACTVGCGRVGIDRVGESNGWTIATLQHAPTRENTERACSGHAM